MVKLKHKVCHLTSVHPPFDVRIFRKECVSLANAGFEVTLIAPINKVVLRDGVRLLPVKFSENRLIRMLSVTFKMFGLARKQQADLYHFHDPELMLCGVLLRLTGKKVIYDIHENVRLTILDKPYLNIFSRKILYWSYLLFEKLCLPFYHQYVLALSEETYFKYYNPKKSTVILNFPKKIVQCQQIKKDADQLRLIYSGAVFEYRGIFEMIELSRLLKKREINFVLDIVGKVWSDDLVKKISRLLKKYELTDQIIFHGFVDASKVADFVARAHAGISLLHPYIRYQEALPTKIFEYMQHGLPVITNNFPLLVNYVEKTETGICIDINHLDNEIEKIVGLIEQPERMKKMGENGIKFTTEKWNWESQAEKLINLYEQILS